MDVNIAIKMKWLLKIAAYKRDGFGSAAYRRALEINLWTREGASNR